MGYIDKDLRKFEKAKLHMLTLEERMELYKSGEWEHLVNAYSLLIRKTASNLAFKYKHDIDDIYQEGLLGAWRGILRFKLDKSDALSSYIMRCATHQMWHYIKDIVIGTNVVDTTNDFDNIKDSYIDVNDDNEKEIEYAISLLKKDEDKYLIDEYYYKGKTLCDIGDKLNLTGERIRVKKLFALSELKIILDKIN